MEYFTEQKGTERRSILRNGQLISRNFLNYLIFLNNNSQQEGSSNRYLVLLTYNIIRIKYVYSFI